MGRQNKKIQVTGSPVTIRRGKMMWIDPKEIQKKQFQMKKQQRLLEVREQSKEIAKNIRKNVSSAQQKEYDKYIKQANEKERKEYEELLKNSQEVNDSTINNDHIEYVPTKRYSEEQNKLDRVIAKERGMKALEKMRQERESREKERNCCPDRQKQIRNIENLRSKLVVSLPKPIINVPKKPDYRSKGFKQKSPQKPLREINKNSLRDINEEGYQVPKLRLKHPNNKEIHTYRLDNKSPEFPRVTKVIQDKKSTPTKRKNKHPTEENSEQIHGPADSPLSRQNNSPKIHQNKKVERTPSPKATRKHKYSNKKKFNEKELSPEITPKKSKIRKMPETDSSISTDAIEEEYYQYNSKSPCSDESDEDFDSSITPLSSSSYSTSPVDYSHSKNISNSKKIKNDSKSRKRNLFPTQDENSNFNSSPSKIRKSFEKKDYSPSKNSLSPKSKGNKNEKTQKPKEVSSKPSPSKKDDLKRLPHNEMNLHGQSQIDENSRHHLVNCYDHNNRFSSTYCICRDKNVMSAIREESNVSSESSYEDVLNEEEKNERAKEETHIEEQDRRSKEVLVSSQKQKQKQKLAQQRGREALAKERTNSDYRQLLEDLKILTTQERALRTIYQPTPPTVFCTNEQDFEKIRDRQHRVQSAFEALHARSYAKKDLATPPSPKRTSYARPVTNCPAPPIILTKCSEPRTVIVKAVSPPPSPGPPSHPPPIMDPCYTLPSYKSYLSKFQQPCTSSSINRYSCNHRPPCGLSPTTIQAKQDLRKLMQKVEDQRANLLNENPPKDYPNGASWSVRAASPESPRSPYVPTLPSQLSDLDSPSVATLPFVDPKLKPESRRKPISSLIKIKGPFKKPEKIDTSVTISTKEFAYIEIPHSKSSRRTNRAKRRSLDDQGFYETPVKRPSPNKKFNSPPADFSDKGFSDISSESEDHRKKRSQSTSSDSGTSSIYSERLSTPEPSPNGNSVGVTSSTTDSPSYDGVKVTVSVNDPGNKPKGPLNRHSEYPQERVCFCPSSVTDSFSRLTVDSPCSKQSTDLNKRRWFETLPRMNTDSLNSVEPSSRNCPHLESFSEEYDPALLYYMSRLLCMSHASVEELTKAMKQASLTPSESTSLSESIISQQCFCPHSKDIENSNDYQDHDARSSNNDDSQDDHTPSSEIIDPDYNERLKRIHDLMYKLRNNPEIWEQISAFENESSSISNKDCSKCRENFDLEICNAPTLTSTPITNNRSSGSEITQLTSLSSKTASSVSSCSTINIRAEMIKRGLAPSPIPRTPKENMNTQDASFNSQRTHSNQHSNSIQSKRNKKIRRH